MGIEGNLREIGLADICQLLAMGRKSGCLSVTDRSNFGYIHFDDGLIVHATVLNRRDRLGELLVANGAVSADALSRARADVRGREDRHYAHALLDQGDVSREALERYQRVEVEEAVYHLFAWEEGSFRFAPGEEPDEAVATLVAIPAENLLLEGARRIDEWTQIEDVVASMDMRFVVVADPRDGEEADLPPHQEKVLERLDGRATVDEIVRAAGMVEFDVARALYEMSREGWVEPVEGGAAAADGDDVPAEEGDPAETSLNLGRAFYRNRMYREAERELLACLEADPGSVEALDRLALVALREGKLEEALGYLDRADEAGEPRHARHRNRALILEREGHLSEALEVLDAATELSGGDDGGLELQRGIVLLKSFQPEEALLQFRAHRAALGDEEAGPLFFANALLAAAMAGEADEAIRLGREGLTAHPWSGPILVNLGAVLERRGEPAAAEALYLRAVGEAQTPPQAHRNLGDLALRRGDRAAARGHYEKAVRLDPGLGDDVFLLLGNLLYEEGDHEAARRLWGRALDLNPDNEVARTNLGLVAAGSGS